MKNEQIKLVQEKNKINRLEEYHQEKRSQEQRVQLRKILIWAFIFCSAYFLFFSDNQAATVEQNQDQQGQAQTLLDQDVSNQNEQQVLQQSQNEAQIQQVPQNEDYQAENEEEMQENGQSIQQNEQAMEENEQSIQENVNDQENTIEGEDHLNQDQNNQVIEQHNQNTEPTIENQHSQEI